MATVLHFLSIGDGSSYELHNLPFAYKIDVTEQDYTLWEPFEFDFCGQVNIHKYTRLPKVFLHIDTCIRHRIAFMPYLHEGNANASLHEQFGI